MDHQQSAFNSVMIAMQRHEVCSTFLENHGGRKTPSASTWQHRSCCLECNLHTICRPPWLCLIFKQTPVKRPCLIPSQELEIGKKNREFLLLVQQKRTNVRFFGSFFFRTTCARVKYRLYWKTPRTHSSLH